MAYINGNRVLQVVLSAGGGTLLTTTTDATLVSGSTYELALTYLAETPKENDFIAYIDNGAITTLYKVTAVDSTNATLTKIGDIGGGSATAGAYYTNTQPTETSGQYTLAASNVYSAAGIELKLGDLIIYIDSLDNNAVKEIYKILDASTSTLSLALIGAISSGGGGTQLYQHNIVLKNVNRTRYKDRIALPPITTNSDTQMDFNALLTWLYNNGYKYSSNGYNEYDQPHLPVCGVDYDSNNSTRVYYRGILYRNSTEIQTLTDSGTGTSGSSAWNITDTVKPL